MGYTLDHITLTLHISALKGVVLSFRGYLAMCRDLCDCHSGGYRYLMDRDQRQKHPTMHRTVLSPLPQQRVLWSDMSLVSQVRKLALHG
jgi:hypothetical protein